MTLVDEKTVWAGSRHGHLTLSELEALKNERDSQSPYSHGNYPSDGEFNKLFKMLAASGYAEEDDELDELLKGFDDIGDNEDKPQQPLGKLTVFPITSEKNEPLLTRTPEITEKDAILPMTSIPEESTEHLIDRIDAIGKQVASGEYSEATQQLLRIISEELSERRIPPISRKCQKFEKIGCKDPLASQFMLDLQVFDLQWIWRWHREHQTDSESFNELFDDIFEDDDFDWEQAQKIAKLKWKSDNKVLALNLQERHQKDLAVLRSNAVKDRLKYEKKKLRVIKQEAATIEDKLIRYITNNPRAKMTADSIPIYKNVWIAMKIAKGSPKLAIAEYEKLTGQQVDRYFIKDRMKRLSKIL